MKHKSIPALLLAVVLLFTVCACGETGDADRDRRKKTDPNGGDTVSVSGDEQIITFGAYEQDNDTSNGKEAIEWLVLAKEGSRLLVISKYALDCQPFNAERAEVTWETCSLRTWLNGTFLNEAFTAEEQKQIHTAAVKADKNPFFETDPGNDTEDKVFLLSGEEATRFFSSDEQRRCGVTDYARTQGVPDVTNTFSVDGKDVCGWLLRTPAGALIGVAYVSSLGVFTQGCVCMVYEARAVRPAMWIDVG